MAWRKGFRNCRKGTKNILEAYERDFSKHTDSSVATKIQYVWNSIPSQLAKENRKFIYGVIKDGRRKMYEIYSKIMHIINLFSILNLI